MRKTRSRARGIARDTWAATKFISQLLFILVVFGWIFYAWVWPVIKFLALLLFVLLSPIWMILWLFLMAVWPLLATAAVLFVIALIAAPLAQTDSPTDKKPSAGRSAAGDDDQEGQAPRDRVGGHPIK
ncbi:MAG: hypothetical protein AAFV46_16135 [Cyanobacteria bacterium J06635_11]